MNSLGNYLRATAAELKQVSWPSRETAIAYVAIVIGVSVLVSLFLGAFDFLFQRIIDIIITTF